MRRLAITVLFASMVLFGCEKGNDKSVEKQEPVVSVEEQLKSAKVELEKKNYEKTVEITIKITQSDPKNSEAYYLQSQAKSLSGDIKEALRLLEEAIKNGFKDFKSLAENKNLDPLKSTPEFEGIIQRHDPSASAKTSITEKEITAGDDVSIKDSGGKRVIKAGDVSITVPND